ncbi:MAG: hypothetical protein KBC64_06005 [Simkaniaceae bacterium]|nr:hypothetical protein [Simkaniaceae bacterium]
MSTILPGRWRYVQAERSEAEEKDFNRNGVVEKEVAQRSRSCKKGKNKKRELIATLFPCYDLPYAK